MIFFEDLFEGVVVLGVDYLDGHLVVLCVDIFLNFIDNIYLIFLIPNVQKHAVLIPAFSFPYEIFAILDGAKQNLNFLVNMEEGLNIIYFTMKAVAAVS